MPLPCSVIKKKMIKRDTANNDRTDQVCVGEKRVYEGRSNAYDGEDIEIEANADEFHSSPCTLCIVSSST